MNLSIIIVNYNTQHYIVQTIQSILRSKLNIDYEIIVVDNNSHDKSCSIIKDEYPKIKVIKNSKNLGFSGAVNVGVKASNSASILLLNPDTIVDEKAIQLLYDSLNNNSKIGVVGGKIINSNGVFQLSSRRAFPGMLTSLFQISGLSYLFPKSRLFGRYNYTYINKNKFHKVDSVSGACIMFEKFLYDIIGGFDEDYFLFFEETDFCIRAKKAGKLVYYVPKALIVHYRGESMKTAVFNVNNIFYQSLLTFYKKNGSRFISSLFFRPIIFFSYKLKNLTSRLRSNSNTLSQVGLDILGVFSSYSIALFVWYGFYYNIGVDFLLYVKHLPILFSYIFSWIFISSLMSYYRQGNIVNGDIFILNILIFLLSSSVIYFINIIAFSRVIVLLLFVLSMFFSVFWRYILSYSKKYQLFNVNNFGDIFSQKIAFIGINDKTLSMIDKIENDSFSKKIVGYFDFKNHNIRFPYLGNLEKISSIIFEKGINEIIVNESNISKYDILRLLPSLSKTSSVLKIIPETNNIFLSKGLVEDFDKLSLVKMDFPYYSRLSLFLKRFFDIIISGLLLILTSPLHLVYFWKRTQTQIFSSNNTSFNVINYTSTYSSIKKLPYIWLILIGKLSFVGSKIKYENDIQKNNYVKPGLTGLHKLHYFNSRYESKDKCDLYYMKNYSLLLDIEIIFRTIV